MPLMPTMSTTITLYPNLLDTATELNLSLGQCRFRAWPFLDWPYILKHALTMENLYFRPVFFIKVL